MILALCLFLIGVVLSAFFSGSETGYYRATRARLTVDAASGNQIAKCLIWLANNPVLFVATVLVGNNLANYVVSHSIVRATREFVPVENFVFELLAALMLTPIVFIYGELLPKDLFFRAPNRLLRGSGAPFMFFCLAFLPVTILLWLLGRILSFVIGESPERLQASIARAELQRLIDEGQDAGVLNPAQRELAQTMFVVANRRLEELCVPVGRMASVHLGASMEEVSRLIQRTGAAEILVTEEAGRRILGYVRTIDLLTRSPSMINEYQELADIPLGDSPISVLMQLQSQKEALARVVDSQQKTVGLIRLQSLSDAVWVGAN